MDKGATPAKVCFWSKKRVSAADNQMHACFKIIQCHQNDPINTSELSAESLRDALSAIEVWSGKFFLEGLLVRMMLRS